MENRNSQIVGLASKIKEEVTRLEAALQALGVESPSFSQNALPELPRSPDIQLAQNTILECCTELQTLVEGPLENLVRITSPRMNILMALHAIFHYNIAKHVAKDEEVSFEEIGQRCNMDVDDARRLIRMAISFHIFQEPRKGFISHTANSAVIADNELLYQWIGLVCDDMWPNGPQLVPAMKKWPGSKEPTETAFALTNGIGMWDFLKENPQKAQRFAQGIQFLQNHPAFDISHLFTSLAWDVDSEHTVVDVGGSHGSIAQALLDRYPKIQIHVQDLPEVISGATVPSQFEGRLYFLAHNFFTEQPLKADVYFLRSILHDWSDKYAIQIIQNLIPALKSGAKVIVNEVCMPEPNTLPFYLSQLIRGYDLAMKQEFNSKERDAEEWVSLFQLADKRFKLSRVVVPPGSILAVVEFVWQPETSEGQACEG